MADKTIKIFSRKKFRFANPNVKILGFNSDTGIANKQPDFEKAYFETEPGVIQDAPIWIKNDKMFAWASSDGDLMEVTVPVKDNPDEAETSRAVAQMSEAAQRGAEGLEKDEEEEEQEKEPADISKGRKGKGK